MSRGYRYREANDFGNSPCRAFDHVGDRQGEWAGRTPCGFVGALMATPRDTCPHCDGRAVTAIDFRSKAGWIDYFRCQECGAVWNVPKRKDSPVHIVASPVRAGLETL